MTKTLVFLSQFFFIIQTFHCTSNIFECHLSFFFVQQQCIINKINVQNLSHEFFLLLLGERTPGGEVDFLFAA